mmetsp:Transcript_6/g.8  ORF Transcript_6/g.8 Transcript_6/m.8 type:complete len:487 (-) Transcript_6:423-1883(-)
MLRHALGLIRGDTTAAASALLNTRGYAAGSLGVSLGMDAPEAALLVRMPERTWGASSELTGANVRAVAGDLEPKRVAVLRDAFGSFDEPVRPLHEVIKSLGFGHVAVASKITEHHARIVVDEYERNPQGVYKLKSASADLLSFLHNKGSRVALMPNLSAEHPITPLTAIRKGVKQSSNEILMVAPTAFGFNEQAAQDNSFMHKASKPGEGSELTRQVLKEYAGLHHQLTEVAGVKVTLYEHDLAHGTPDACFPNNWFSTHPVGEASGGTTQSTLVFYPMKHPNRQAERRQDMIGVLKGRGYNNIVDMSVHESDNKFLEGTGSLVIDRVNGVAYVALSERADERLAQEWVQKLGYKELVTFRSTDLRGKGVYHTNVMMGIGTGVAIVCAESVQDLKERNRLLCALKKTHEVVEVSLAQIDALCGNVLEVEDGKGLPAMAMSTQAYNAFTEEQRKVIRRNVNSIVHAPIDTLERVGGGGVRCTLAELF